MKIFTSFSSLAGLILVISIAFQLNSQTMIPIPPHGSVYTGAVRGFWFTAPINMVITGLRVPTDAGNGPQYIHLIKLAAPPPAYSANTSNFTTLAYIQGASYGVINQVNIPINQGDYIGVLGEASTGCDYSTVSGLYNSSIAGQTVVLERLLYQGHINGGPAPNVSKETGGTVARVEVYWTYPITAPNNAGVLSIDSPAAFCEGAKNIVATIKNFGTNQIDSVTVNWTFNGTVQTPIIYQQLLDTFNGTGSQTAQIMLGNKTFTNGVKDKIVAWTSLPNNKQDTVTKDDTAMADVQPAISGNFTIDPSGSGTGNYTSFTNAVKDLNEFGVCGPVTYEVAAGTYAEQFKIMEINGASSTNTISFLPEPNGTVVVSYNSSTTDNYIVSLDGATNISFSDITFESGSGSSYGAAVELMGEASYNKFENCILNGKSISTTSYLYSTIICYNSSGNNGNEFINCQINDGSFGAYIYSGSTVSTNDNLVFDGCTFKNAYYMGAYIYGSKDLIFSHNKIQSNTSYTSSYGVEIYYTYDNTQFVGNKIHYHYMGAYLYYFNGTTTKQPLIANNWIVGENSSYYCYGLYYYGGFARIVHNTIWKNASSSYGYYTAIIGGGANTVLNNIMYTTSGSSTYYGYYANGTFAIGESDYNAFYNPVQYFGYFNGVINTFNDWKTQTGFDQNSIYTDPAYSSYDSLRTCNDTIDAAGTPLSYVTTDIDGDDRDPMHPDIGADEWIGTDSGSYSAGPDAIVCAGKTAQIGLKVTGGTFMWSNNETTPIIEVNQAGTYQVTMTTICGATHMDEVVVEDVTPVADFSSQFSFRTGVYSNTSANGDTYRWIVGVSPPDTLWKENLTYIFPDNGPYEVCLAVYNDCDTVEKCETWFSTVGIEENSLDNFISIRPNPVSDILNIQFNGLKSDNVVVEMTGVQGQLVYRDNYVNVSGNATKSIDVSSLNKGMYILKFVTENGVTAKRIVIR